MLPLDVASLITMAFESSVINVDVVTGPEFHRDYPLASGVSRASTLVERHRPAIIKLEYQGEGPIEKITLTLTLIEY